jgi:hypothetical protein
VPATEVEGKVAGGRRGSTSVYRLPDRRRSTLLKSVLVNRDRRPVDDSYLVTRGTLLSGSWGNNLIADGIQRSWPWARDLAAAFARLGLLPVPAG